MKTLLIYQEIGVSEQLEFIILHGDYSMFHGIQINTGRDEVLEECFINFFFDELTGERIYNMQKDFTILNRNFDKIAFVQYYL